MPRSIRLFALAISLALVAAGLLSGDRLSDARWLAVLGLAWTLLLFGLWAPIPPGTPTERRTVIRTGATLATGFVALSVQLLRMQGVRGEAMADRVAVSPDGEPISNPRRVDLGLATRRGRILSAGGDELAGTERIAAGWGRTYPEPAAGGLLGYYSPLQYGQAGIEQAFDGELTGERQANPLLEIRDDLLHRTRRGNDVVLTIDLDLQRVTSDAMADRAGAAILIEVGTGRVLAMVSNPAPDPARLFAGDYDETDAAGDYWDTLIAREDRPLVARSTLGLYTPGSIFKVVTASAAIDRGAATPETVYIDDGTLDVSGRQIVENANRPDPAQTQWSLEDGLAYSLNVVFAQVGLELGARDLRDYADRFGFGLQIPFVLPVARSQIEGGERFLDSPPALAETSFGQGQLLVTPLHMAVIAAGIANGGELMRPRILDRVVDPDGVVIREGESAVWRRAISEKTAATMVGMMRHAVEVGVASGATIDGLAVGGKTGTAEVTGLAPHAWFIGFAGTFADDAPRHAVAVVLENGGSGSVDVARQVLLAAADRS